MKQDNHIDATEGKKKGVGHPFRRRQAYAQSVDHLRHAIDTVLRDEGATAIKVNEAWRQLETALNKRQIRPDSAEGLVRRAAQDALRVRPGAVYHVNRVRELFFVRIDAMSQTTPRDIE